jgi:hypothetical protein
LDVIAGLDPAIRPLLQIALAKSVAASRRLLAQRGLSRLRVEGRIGGQT